MPVPEGATFQKLHQISGGERAPTVDRTLGQNTRVSLESQPGKVNLRFLSRHNWLPLESHVSRLSRRFHQEGTKTLAEFRKLSQDWGFSALESYHGSERNPARKETLDKFNQIFNWGFAAGELGGCCRFAIEGLLPLNSGGNTHRLLSTTRVEIERRYLIRRNPPMSLRYCLP